MGKIVSFQTFQKYSQEKTAQEKKRLGKLVGNEYCCYVSNERMQGHCELLICEKDETRAEDYILSFSEDGRNSYKVLDAGAIRGWLKRNEHRRITYLQAIRLLGDSVRQGYKYRKEIDPFSEVESVHLQRIWQEQYYNDREDEMEWVLPHQTFGEMLWTYFRALSNKDATLLYDMSAEPVRNAVQRSMFAYHWNHALEDLWIMGYDVDPKSFCCNGENDYTLYVTVRGNYKVIQTMEADLRMRVVEEKNGFRVLQTQVLEAREIFPRFQLS